MSRILVVEDEVALNHRIRDQLTRDGHEVDQAFDGPSALEAVQRHVPDVVILDWMLPRLDGLEVCRQLRRRHLMPIIMLTARDAEADRVTGLEVGADDYVVKPFSPAELGARVRATLRRMAITQAAGAQDGTTMVSGPLVLDRASYSATLAGARLDLTRREVELLDLFLRNPGRTFTRDYLMERLWSSDTDAYDRAVDTQMTRLRRKLGDFGRSIEAVWGVGYRFRPDASTG